MCNNNDLPFEDILLKIVEQRFEQNMQFLKAASDSVLSKDDKNKLLNLSEEEVLQKKDKLLKHSQKVMEIALDICNRVDEITEEDRALIKSAALLHDIEKVFLEDYDNDHNKRGAKYIKKDDNIISQYFSDKDKKSISLMIKWHNGDGYIYKDYSNKMIRMIEIVRVADKIARIYKRSIEFCAYSIINHIANLEDRKIKNVASIVLFERINSLKEE